MIAFGCAISEPEAYRLYAEPGIRRAKEPDSEVYAFSAVGTIFRSYNLLLDTAAHLEDLEALVLVHPHAEITDPAFCAKVREALSDPDVAVVGAAGAREVRSIAWWEGEVVASDILHRYNDHGGGELRALSWAGDALPPPAEVEVVDGFLMVLSPWAVRNVRFDEALGLGHGYDVDYCLQVRAAGRKVTVADLGLTHHRSLELIADLDLWVESHIRVAEKWEEQLYGPVGRNGTSWEQRGRQAEAEREAERAIAYGHALHRDARVLLLQRALNAVTGTRSWWLTEPLRRLNKARADRREASSR
jgi:hypothetical protein